MTVVIIPGFIGYPEEVTFKELEKKLFDKGNSVIKIAWPFFPNELDKYSFTNTISYTKDILENEGSENLAILGFSMGGIIATVLASSLKPKKLGLIVSPYQAGTDDDLAEKYKEWKENGYLETISSKFGRLRIPFSFIEDAQKHNALDYISKINCQKLFIAGEQDTNVPLKVSRKLFDAANEPKTWQQIPGMEHKYQYQTDMLPKVNEIILDFLENC